MTFHFPPPPPEAPRVFWRVRRTERLDGAGLAGFAPRCSPAPTVVQYLTSFRFGTSVECESHWQGRRDAAHEFTSRPLARACAIALGANLIKVTRRRPS